MGAQDFEPSWEEEVGRVPCPDRTLPALRGCLGVSPARGTGAPRKDATPGMTQLWLNNPDPTQWGGGVGR